VIQSPRIYKNMTTMHPIDDVLWRDVDELKSSDYNPNHVATNELDLLATSLLEDGWTQPIVTRQDGKIVDGHHRFIVAKDHANELQKDGKVPCVILNHQTEGDQRISTIRHNRASGAHMVDAMAENVRFLVEQSELSDGEIAKRVGMEQEEIKRLSRQVKLPDKHSDDDYERAWKPQGPK